MSNRWITTILSLTTAAFLFTACKRNYSSDNPIPTSYYPSVIISSDNNVIFAIDPSTGKRNWQYAIPNDTGTIATPFKPSPLLYHERVYITSVNSDTVYKLDANTGLLIKKLVVGDHVTVPYPGHFFTVISTPIADANLIYLATTNDTLYAIDTGTGATKWKFGAHDMSSFNASPVIYNNYIYVATVGSGPAGATNGHVYCIDKTNGPDANGYPVWDYPGQDTTSNASFISSPCISAPYLYIGSACDSNMYCIYLNPTIPPSPPTPLRGELRWTFKTNGNILSSPTAYAGICLFGSNDFNLYCVDTHTSIARWKFLTKSQIKSSPIISNQVVYVGSYDYNLYAINLINGQQKWKYATKGLIKSSPVPYNGYIYVGSYDNYLYAVDSTFGTQKWQYYINGNIECSPVIDNLSGKDQINSGISGYNTSGNNN